MFQAARLAQGEPAAPELSLRQELAERSRAERAKAVSPPLAVAPARSVERARWGGPSAADPVGV